MRGEVTCMRAVRFGIGLFGAAWLLAVAAPAEPQPGAVFVLTEPGEIHRVDRATGATTLVATPVVGLAPLLALDAQGRGLLRGRDGEVLRADLETGIVTPLAEGGYLNGTDARGIAADGDHAIATSSVEVEGVPRGAIVRIDPAGVQELIADVPRYPKTVAIEADGSILVLYAWQILRVDRATGDTEVVASWDLLGHARDLEVLPDGTIAVLQLGPDLENSLVLVDPVTGVQSLPPVATELEGEIDFNRVTGIEVDAQGTLYVTTGRGLFADEAFPGGLVSVVLGGLARGVTSPSAFYAPYDVAVPEPGVALLLAAGASLLLFLRLVRR